MEGYDHLSSNMAQYSEFAIFRTFKILNYRALLFKQAELAEKEARLILAIKEDRNSGDPERQRFAFSFGAMLNSTSDSDGSKVQRGLMREICRLLPEYSTWFLLTSFKPARCFLGSLLTFSGCCGA
ncbi:uncharacterized protein PV07_00516 [Cladophialophora immunda]|uniref:DUF6594 domain-containing protein n=1 Tax=Cladophialophora immunda TaxID=569365 RepID=A0A0D2CR51_9EURO|nr:uncharacterized protein PV07_00516 [Cladophialophora immunda]KIW33688.1 hypothetical protein PV07_00516 [Cladophialophora immunda]